MVSGNEGLRSQRDVGLVVCTVVDSKQFGPALLLEPNKTSTPIVSGNDVVARCEIQTVRTPAVVAS
jgi:hypothetical protein